MKWTHEQIEEILDKFAQAFVEQVEAAGGKATIRATPSNKRVKPTPPRASKSKRASKGAAS